MSTAPQSDASPPPWRAVQALLMALALYVIVVVLAFTTMVEFVFLYPPRLGYYAGAAGVVVAAALLGHLVRGARRAPTTRLAVFTVAALLLLHLVPWTSRKVFLQHFRRIEIGMTWPEVEQVMAGFSRGTGLRVDSAPVAIADVAVFRHSDDPRYNRDFGTVRFDQQGCVVAVWFDSD